MSVAVILGSAWQTPELGGQALIPFEVETRFGPVLLHRWNRGRPAWVLFRHGAPHRFLPNQIPYRAHVCALAEVGVDAVLLTSSVGVMDLSVPLFTPLLVDDLVMLDNRLPDGSTCTIYDRPWPGQGHLVIDEGLFSKGLGEQVRALSDAVGHPIGGSVEFTYVGGPRTKTAAENRLLARLGAQVNSMTLAPEAILLAELGIPVAAVVVGHKHSHPDAPPAAGETLEALADSLDASRAATEALAMAWLARAKPVPTGNRLFRFGDEGLQ